jgi:dihydroxyacid dehydratase/phosphogluconate dehydratase
MGCVQADYAGKPVIAVINTWSDINPCHSHLRERAGDVKRGVWQSGGFPVEMPAITLGETFQKPTTMMYRNLLAMETEELAAFLILRTAVCSCEVATRIRGTPDGRDQRESPAIFVTRRSDGS